MNARYSKKQIVKSVIFVIFFWIVTALLFVCLMKLLSFIDISAFIRSLT